MQPADRDAPRNTFDLVLIGAGAALILAGVVIGPVLEKTGLLRVRLSAPGALDERVQLRPAMVHLNLADVEGSGSSDLLWLAQSPLTHAHWIAGGGEDLWGCGAACGPEWATGMDETAVDAWLAQLSNREGLTACAGSSCDGYTRLDSTTLLTICPACAKEPSAWTQTPLGLLAWPADWTPSSPPLILMRREQTP